MTDDAVDLRAAVEAAAAREEVSAAVAQVYATVQAAIDERKPLCTVSGKCCRFEEYGHRLYVSTIELAAFVAGDVSGQLSAVSGQVETSIRTLPVLATDNGQLATDPAWDGTGCPFQRAKLCTVHGSRPFGCRIYFCDPTSTQWQNDAYERFHAEMKLLHEVFGVPYFYVEWRYALRELGLATPAVGLPVLPNTSSF